MESEKVTSLLGRLSHKTRNKKFYPANYMGNRLPYPYERKENRFNSFQKEAKTSSSVSSVNYSRVYGQSSKAKLQKRIRREKSRAKKQFQEVGSELEKLVGSEQNVGRLNKVLFQKEELPLLKRQPLHNEKIRRRMYDFNIEPNVVMTGDEFQYSLSFQNNHEVEDYLVKKNLTIKRSSHRLSTVIYDLETMEELVNKIGKFLELQRNEVRLPFFLKMHTSVIDKAFSCVSTPKLLNLFKTHPRYRLKIVEWFDISDGFNFYKIRFFDLERRVFESGSSDPITAGIIPFGEYETCHGLIGYHINRLRFSYYSFEREGILFSSVFSFRSGDLSDQCRAIGNTGKEKEIFTRTKSSEFFSNFYSKKKFFTYVEYVQRQIQFSTKLIEIFKEDITDSKKKKKMKKEMGEYDKYYDCCLPIFITEGLPEFNLFCNPKHHDLNVFLWEKGILPSSAVSKRLSSVFNSKIIKFYFNSSPWESNSGKILLGGPSRVTVVRNRRIIFNGFCSKIKHIKDGDRMYCSLYGRESCKTYQHMFTVLFSEYRPMIPLLHIFFSLLKYVKSDIVERGKEENNDKLNKQLRKKSTTKTEIMQLLYSLEMKNLIESEQWFEELCCIRLLECVEYLIRKPSRRTRDEVYCLGLCLGALVMVESFEHRVGKKIIKEQERNRKIIENRCGDAIKSSSQVDEAIPSKVRGKSVVFCAGVFVEVKSVLSVFYQRGTTMDSSNVFVSLKGVNNEKIIVPIQSISSKILEMIIELHGEEWVDVVVSSVNSKSTSPFRLSHFYQFGTIGFFISSFCKGFSLHEIDDNVIEREIGFGNRSLQKCSLEDFEGYEEFEKSMRYKKNKVPFPFCKKIWNIRITVCSARISDFLKNNLRDFMVMFITGGGVIFYSVSTISFLLCHDISKKGSDDVIVLCPNHTHHEPVDWTLVNSVNVVGFYKNFSKERKKHAREDNPYGGDRSEDYKPKVKKMKLIPERNHGTRKKKNELEKGRYSY